MLVLNSWDQIVIACKKKNHSDSDNLEHQEALLCVVWIFRTFKYETAEIREETHETEKKPFQ